MAIVQTLCTSFKTGLFRAEHNFDTDTFYIALYTSAASLGETTIVYTASSEVVGTGYTAGGIAITGVSVAVSGTTPYITFNNATWVTSTILARGALIYNISKTNKAVAVLSFGADKQSSGTSFVVQMPANTVSTALIRML